jgi:serine/threonine protein kinase
MFRENDYEPVLVDFGLVRDLASTSLTLTWLVQGPGTPFFASPEQLNNDKYLIDWRSDQFSVGIVLAMCLNGRHPFHEKGFTEMQTVEAVLGRRRCSEDFRSSAIAAGLSVLIKMVGVWPIQRFSEPNALISTLQTGR